MAWEDYWVVYGLVFEFTIPYTYQQNGAAEYCMQIILNRVQYIMAESGMALKYWTDAVWTIVYVQNFIPFSQQPKIILAEVWLGKQQDIFYLRPFVSTAYIYIPQDLNLYKLSTRSVQVSLLGYFRYNGYKLLDKSTGIVFRSQDVIFEKEITYIAK